MARSTRRIAASRGNTFGVRMTWRPMPRKHRLSTSRAARARRTCCSPALAAVSDDFPAADAAIACGTKRSRAGSSRAARAGHRGGAAHSVAVTAQGQVLSSELWPARWRSRRGELQCDGQLGLATVHFERTPRFAARTVRAAATLGTRRAGSTAPVDFARGRRGARRGRRELRARGTRQVRPDAACSREKVPPCSAPSLRMETTTATAAAARRRCCCTTSTGRTAARARHRRRARVAAAAAGGAIAGAAAAAPTGSSTSDAVCGGDDGKGGRGAADGAGRRAAGRAAVLLGATPSAARPRGSPCA